MEKTEARIKEAEVYKTNELFGKKPPGLGFGDTDAVILTLKTQEGEIKRIFYPRLKADGTPARSLIGRFTRSRQNRFLKFLKHYGITDDPENFNVKKDVSELEGRKVEITRRGEVGSIYVSG